MTEPYLKPALTFETQLTQLEDRGLIVTDRDHALAQLSSVSYYRLSAYWQPFKERDEHGVIADRFKDGTSFDDAMMLYDFDRNLRMLVMDAIERIEVQIRTRITYHLGHKYGAFAHDDPSNFHPQFDHQRWIAKMEEETKRSRDAFIANYKNKYDGFPTIPIWMLTEVMSLGSLSHFYKGLAHDDKRAISGQFGLHHQCLENWLHVLNYVRNVCAHHSRLWNRELAIRPGKTKDANWLPPVTPRNDRVFFILLMLCHLLKSNCNGDDWPDACSVLLGPMAAIEQWRVAMGMPENWKEHPVWI